MTRSYCPQCQRPQRVCLCQAITPTEHRITVHILMHPSEQKCAKGTAKLTHAVLKNSHIWLGESEDDFTSLRQHLADKPSFVLYPSDNAHAVEHTTLPEHAQLLLIDGTWRKAHKILQLNPWLMQLPSLTFATAPEGNYQIRKAHRTDSLSTLEATAYALEQLEGLDPTPLLRAFEALKHSQLGQMPNSVRQRYQSK